MTVQLIGNVPTQEPFVDTDSGILSRTGAKWLAKLISLFSQRIPQFFQGTAAGPITLNSATFTDLVSMTFKLPAGGPWRLLFTAKYYLSEVAGGNAVNVSTRVTDGTLFSNTDTDGEATTVSGNVIGIKFFDWWGVLLAFGVTKTFKLQAAVSNAGDTYQANGVIFTVIALPS